MIGKTNATVIIGGGSTVIIREYTSSTTWNKPSGLKYLLVVCVGAGGGGGSGRRGAANTNRYGGCAGSGGYMVKRYIKENLLNATESIVIGTGGNGGVSQTNDNTDGVNGSNGGDSSFGTLVVAKASGGGLGGRTSSYASGESVPVTNCVPKYYFTTACCTSPASTNGTPANYGIKPFANPNQGTQGGMVGAGINSSNLVGGMISLPNLVKADNTEQTGTSGGANGADNVCLQLLNEYATVSITKGIGAGGGGGAAGDAAGTIAGGNGGNGGIYGAGGGGGGASTNGANSGAGGNGANGLVLVLEIY